MTYGQNIERQSFRSFIPLAIETSHGVADEQDDRTAMLGARSDVTMRPDCPVDFY
jgi:hypothetical protein